VQGKSGWEKQKEEKAKEEAEKGEDSRSEESSRGIENMGRERGSGKIRGGSEETSAREVP